MTPTHTCGCNQAMGNKQFGFRHSDIDDNDMDAINNSSKLNLITFASDDYTNHRGSMTSSTNLLQHRVFNRSTSHSASSSRRELSLRQLVRPHQQQIPYISKTQHQHQQQHQSTKPQVTSTSTSSFKSQMVSNRQRRLSSPASPSMRLNCGKLAIALCLALALTYTCCDQLVAGAQPEGQLRVKRAFETTTTSPEETTTSVTTTGAPSTDATTTASPTTTEQPTTTTTKATTTTTPKPTTTSAAPTSSGSASDSSSLTKKTKLPAIDWKLVEENYSKPINESEAIQVWSTMNKNMKLGVQKALKAIFPHVASMSSDAKVSGACSGAMLKWILNLQQMKTWAVKMFDASGKPSAGMLEGSMTMFGNYRECLTIRAPDEDEIELVEEFREYFRGKYCVLQMRPPLPPKPRYYGMNSSYDALRRPVNSYKPYDKLIQDEMGELAMAFNFASIRMDFCVPSLCSRDDLQRIADFLGKKMNMRAKIARCEVDQSPIPGTPEYTHPKSLLGRLDETQRSWVAATMGLMGMVFASTLLHALIVRGREPKVGHSSSDDPNESSQSDASKRLGCTMSIQNALTQMCRVKSRELRDLASLRIKVVYLCVLMWILLIAFVHTINFTHMRDLMPLRDLVLMQPSQFVVNSTLAFEALFLIAGFCMAFEHIANASKPTTYSQLIKYVASKYFRFVVPVLAIVGLTVITPALYLGHSPVWLERLEGQTQICTKNWLPNVFFLQTTLLKPSEICLPHTWLLCVELQLCILAIPLVYWFARQFERNPESLGFKSLPMMASAGAIAFCCARNWLVIFQRQMPGAWLLTYVDPDDKDEYMGVHLFTTNAHIAPFVVGIVAGWLVKTHMVRELNLWPSAGQKTRRHSSNVLGRLTGTIVSLTLSLASLVCMGLLIFQADYSAWLRNHAAEHAAFGPLLWSVCFAWLMSQYVLANLMSSRNSSASGRRSSYDLDDQHEATHELAASGGQGGSKKGGVQFDPTISYPADSDSEDGDEFEGDDYPGYSASLGGRSCIEMSANLVRMARLSVLLYLCAYYINDVVFAMQESAVFTSILMIGHTMIGNLVFTTNMAVCLGAMVAIPCERLASRIFSLDESKRRRANFNVMNVMSNSQNDSNGDKRAMQMHHPNHHAHHHHHQQSGNARSFANAIDVNMGN